MWWHRSFPSVKLAIKALVFALFLGGVITPMFAARAKPPVKESFVAPSSGPTSQISIPTIPLKLPPLPVLITTHFNFADQLRVRSLYWGGCGWGTPSGFNFEPRVTKLPDDPTLVLADGYRRCTTINVAVIEPRLLTGTYPVGHFGKYSYEGFLVTDWLEFSEEPALKRVFDLLITVSRDPERWSLYFDDIDNPEQNLADYRTTSHFVPDVLFEFVGETNLRVEINLTSGRVLIQSNNRWDTYAIDGRSAAALENMILAEQSRLRREQDSECTAD